VSFNAEDPVETHRKVFSKVKAKVSGRIDLDEEEDPQLQAKVEGEALFESPFLEVLKDVKARLLILLEIEPSINYITNTTRTGRVGGNKVLSKKESIKKRDLP
jgi:hypothetical protein